jgi:hypothetical protein
MFNNAPFITPEKLRQAIEKNRQFLRAQFDDKSLEISLIEHDDDEIKTYTKKRYNQSWSNQDGSDWNILINNILDSSDRFAVSIYSQKFLTGLCLYQIKDGATPSERLQIHTIERNKARECLKKGYLIAAYSQIGLEICRAQQINELTVLNPGNNTIPSYHRLGFGISARGEISLPIDDTTTLNWQATEEHVLARTKALAVLARV